MSTAVAAGCYVFGIVPAGATVPPSDESGPASGLHLVTADGAAEGLAALVGRVPTDRPLGRATDLRAHDRVLADVVAAGTPVLPMRFGAVVTDDDAVVSELLAPHEDEFRDALDAVRGRVQYRVKARYEESVVLSEVVRTDPQVRRLRAASAERDDPAVKVRLGESVVRALDRMRPGDASALLTELLGTVDVRVRDGGAPEQVLDASFLVDADRGTDFEQRVEDVAARHSDRLRISLIGPSAPYDFVGSG